MSNTASERTATAICASVLMVSWNQRDCSSVRNGTTMIFTAHRTFPSAVYASVCPFACPSVTLRYYVKTRDAEGCNLHHRVVSQVFWRQEWLTADDPVQVVQKGQRPCENSRAVHISPHNSGRVIDSEKSSINANTKSIMGFTCLQCSPRTL